MPSSRIHRGHRAKEGGGVVGYGFQMVALVGHHGDGNGSGNDSNNGIDGGGDDGG
jgi:hypothetical protein